MSKRCTEDCCVGIVLCVIGVPGGLCAAWLWYNQVFVDKAEVIPITLGAGLVLGVCMIAAYAGCFALRSGFRRRAR